ncbi:MAG: hypothetical protein H6806_10910 [Planctomycetes bacterium]|nr:hypothetical protein [Planctomycetota bacterium]
MKRSRHALSFGHTPRRFPVLLRVHDLAHKLVGVREAKPKRFDRPDELAAHVARRGHERVLPDLGVERQPRHRG